jgi:hypothetical protein
MVLRYRRLSVLRYMSSCFGEKYGFVVRHLEGGIAIEFLKFLYNQKEYRLSGVAL